MHKFQSPSAILRLRLASLLLLLNRYVLIPSFFILLIRSFLHHSTHEAIIALGVLPLLGLSALFQYLLSTRTYCPLCMTPVLGTRSCTKHRNSKKFLGSYRLPVAVGALFRGSIRCTYCNEPSRLAVRQRRSGKF